LQVRTNLARPTSTTVCELVTSSDAMTKQEAYLPGSEHARGLMSLEDFAKFVLGYLTVVMMVLVTVNSCTTFEVDSYHRFDQESYNRFTCPMMLRLE